MKAFVLQVCRFWFLLVRRKTAFILFLVLPVLIFPASLLLFRNTAGRQAVVGICAGNHDPAVSFLVSALESGDKYSIVYFTGEQEGKDHAADGELLALAVFGDNTAGAILSYREKPVHLVSIYPPQTLETLHEDINRYVRIFREMSEIAAAADAPVSSYLNEYLNSVYTVRQDDIDTNAGYYQAVIQGTGMIVVLLLIQVFYTCGLLFSKESLIKNNAVRFSGPFGSASSAFTASFLLAALQLLEAFIPAALIFGIPFEISVALLLLFFSGFLACSFALAYPVLFLNRGRFRFYELIIIFILPGAVLSGCILPLNVLPKIITTITPFFPQYRVLHAVQTVQNGQGMLLPDLAVLLCFCLLGLLLSFLVVKFSRPAAKR